jgi:hypothetical protein
MLKKIETNRFVQVLYNNLKHTDACFQITDKRTGKTYNKNQITSFGQTISAFEYFIYTDGEKYEDRKLLVFLKNNNEIYYIAKKSKTYELFNNGRPTGKTSNVYQIYLKENKITLCQYDPMPIDVNQPFTMQETRIMSDDEYESGERGV